MFEEIFSASDGEGGDECGEMWSVERWGGSVAYCTRRRQGVSVQRWDGLELGSVSCCCALIDKTCMHGAGWAGALVQQLRR
jgi:hypothetical protein